MANHYEKLVSLSVSERTEYIKTLDGGALNDTMKLAAENDHITIVRLCKKHGATDFNRVLEHAAKNGDSTLVHDCIEWGATNFDQAAVIAAANDQSIIMNILQIRTTANFDQAMVAAVENGHECIVQMCKEWGATINFNHAITLAAKNGYIGIVRSFITWGATDADVSDALAILVPKGDNFAVEYDNLWCRSRLDIAMEKAAACGQIKVVQLCLRLGSFSYYETITLAEANGHNNISSFVKEWEHRHNRKRLNVLKIIA